MSAPKLAPPINCSPLPAPAVSSAEAIMRSASPAAGAPAPTGDTGTAGVTVANLTLLLGKDRKQNSACDACRVRKVKCVRTEDDSTCTFCISKHVECTRYYMALATEASNKRAVQKKRRRQTSGGGMNIDSAVETSTTTPTLRVRTRSSSSDLLQEGAMVQVRSQEKGVPWESQPHRVHRIIYRPVAVVLDHEDSIPIAISHVRSLEQQTGDSMPPTPGQSMPPTPSLSSSDAYSTFTSSEPPTPLNASPTTSQFFTESFARPSQPMPSYAVPAHAYMQEWQEPNYVTYSASPALSQHASSPALSQQSMMYSPYMTSNGYFSNSSYSVSPVPQNSAFFSASMDDTQMAYYRSALQPATTHVQQMEPEAFAA